MSIPHGALCGSEVSDCGVAGKFCVYSSRRPVSEVCECGCLSSVSIPHGALCWYDVCDCGVAV